ncbi:SEL1-like repeat protein [Chitinophaga ginsengisoli]|uniref:TPR repeat protein n=1 Tax=Chitinophaga ginsengisoli TaxID=363837 RepID=A0A2P8G585_9BACT|nr:SEL1-like repeat protein [Chitinophaga ginsengisoli]PSL29150.1 TPR repeat protein [Chitinophaga ginsengisoli]
MSHSVYLGNTNSPSGKDRNDIMMMEWGYEMPLLLQPLLISGGFIENDILYYDAKSGIENLKKFYNFLDATKSLINNRSIFTECKNKLFKYLDGLEHAYFSMNARDVFNMDEAPHNEQAAIWLADIAYNNAMITRAMDNNDISLLSYDKLKHVSMAFHSFAELLNYADYSYGWKHINQDVGKEEIYYENGLWGLKSAEGEILLSPQFDDFYAFSEQDIAVVMKAQKYGYVHRSGKVIAPAEWDEAYDFDHSYLAIVQRNGLLALINPSGKIVVAPTYENLNRVGYDGHYIAQKNGKWGVLGEDAKVIVGFKYEKIELLHDNVFMLLKDGFYSLTEDGEQFDLIVRKAPHQGFAWAIKGEKVYLIDKYGISRANKDLVQQDAESDGYSFYYDEVVRDRLLAYAKTPDEETTIDVYTPVEELYNIGVDAYNRQDYASAIYHYTLAAEKGYGYAMNNLAHIYYMIDGYVDNDSAFYWYEKGAAARNTNALNGLSLCYQNGIGTIPDIEKAINLLQQAAEDGLAVAHNNLGFLLSDTDPEQALYHFHQAEELGEPDYGCLGYLYEEKGDFEIALRYYQKDESEIGAFNQGVFHQRGLGTAKDLKAAIGYFKTAIAGGYDWGHIELARIYLFEEGFIDKDRAKAHIAAAEKAGLEIPDELLM